KMRSWRRYWTSGPQWSLKTFSTSLLLVKLHALGPAELPGARCEQLRQRHGVDPLQRILPVRQRLLEGRVNVFRRNFLRCFDCCRRLFRGYVRLGIERLQLLVCRLWRDGGLPAALRGPLGEFPS